MKSKRDLSLRSLIARSGNPPKATRFAPTRLMVVDLEQPLPSIDIGSTPAGEPYQAAEILVRLHARPLGALKIDLAAGAVSMAQLPVLIEQRWGDIVKQHMKADEEAQHEIATAGVTEYAGNTCVLRPATSPPYVSVVVPTYRRPTDLARCVESILATGYPRLEVIVVDNGPQEPQAAALVAERYAADHRVRYLSEWTAGASRARNLGVRAARGEIIAFVDDDVVVDRHWIAALVHAFVANPDVDCVTGLTIPAALDKPVQLWFEQFGGFNRGYEPRVFDLGDQRGDTFLYPYTAGAFGGLANSAFRRTALRQPDAFDVTLGPGTPAFAAEDQDAFVALLRAGGRLLYEPAALAHHRHRDNYPDLRWQIFTYGAGQTAAFVHWALTDRAVAMELVRRVPGALPMAFGLRRRSHFPETAPDPCPQPLRWLERMGYVYGPVAYGRALLWRRRVRSRTAPAPADNIPSRSLERGQSTAGRQS